MFVFRLDDGRYYKESGARYIDSLSMHRYSIELDKKYGPLGRTESRADEFFTTDINEAKLFKSRKAVQSSNVYSWGGTIHEVKVNLTLV